MSLFTNIKKRYQRATPKQFILAGVFMLAFAGAIGGGFAARSASTAATLRDCDNNAIMKCGAADKGEFIDKIKSSNNGQNKDLKTVYAHFGLSSSEYDDFEREARYGTFYRDGRIVVDGQTVATGAYSLGRQNFGGSQKYPIGSKTYYYATPSKRWASSTKSLPVMVWFDKNGVVEMVIMSPCGNPVPKMKKKTHKAECEDLNKFAVSGKKNTYQFSTDAYKSELVKYVKFNYYYNDGSGWKLFDSKTSPSSKTKEITFTKSSKVKVEIEISLPGKNKKTITSKLCEKEIGVVKEKFLYACEALVRTEKDNRVFRFTVHTKQSNNVTVDSADFTLDGDVTTKGVTTKDSQGNFYKEYDFSDNKEHRVSAIVNFTADGKKVTSKEGDCVAKVLPKEVPECPEKPGSGLPPGHPDCQEKPEECKPGVPVGSDECEELPVTGAGSVAGLVAGVTAAGAIGHRLYSRRRG